MTRLLDELSPQERLQVLKRARAANLKRVTKTLPRIMRAERPASIPLSYAQQRLWFIDQLSEKAGTAYQIGGALRFEGELNLEALQWSLDELLKRHEVLRTVFASEGGHSVQVIQHATAFALQKKDLSALSGSEQAASVQAEADDDRARCFDLQSGPVTRGRLLKLSPQQHVLLLMMHHIVSDGWSIGILTRELSTLYRARCAGRGNELPELPLQYADYTLWQQQWLQGAELKRQLEYWRESLRGAPEYLALPTQHARPAMQTYRGDSIGVSLGRELSAALRELSKRQETTLFMALCAGFAVLLARLSGQEDLVIATPVANRQTVELETLVGLFVNTLALRVDVSARQSVPELLQQMKKTTLGGYAHQGTPFEQVVEALKPARSLSYSPLVQVMFALQNAPGAALDFGEVKQGTQEQVAAAAAQFDLSLALRQVGDEIVGTVTFASDLFERRTVERWLEYYRQVLRGLVRHELGSVGELSLGGEAELQRLRAFNAPIPVEHEERCLHELFEEQVRRTPDSIALVCDLEHVTYAEVNSRANQLARYLQARGARAERVVGLCAERSVEQIVGLLGILKSGAAYLPLDPVYPVERLAYLVADAAPLLVLAGNGLGARFDAGPVIELDDAEIISQPRLPVARSTAGNRTLAYVMYTSGSTGTPKGVQVEHAQVVRLFGATRKWFAFDADQTWSLFHSISFDVSVWELWGALLHGGRAVIVPREVTQDPEAFYRLICAQAVTNLSQTPGAFRSLTSAQQRSGQKHQLKFVVFAGEALQPSMLRGWYAQHPERAPLLINMYGITETTVHSTYHELTAQEAELGGSSIGTRIPDLQLYVLDGRGEPVPIGVAGELYVGGAGLARGYLKRPDLTAQRFVPDPFSSAAGARMYRSGDLVRWSESGDLEYIGRNDDQVKIRGYRIELGEIEGQLQRHPAVREAVVVARPVKGEAQQRLIVYYSVRADTSPAELRAFIEQRLPPHMVPSAFVLLDQLPLTANGKVDRRRLPDADEQALIRRAYAAPEGRIEPALAQIWADLLQLLQVSRDDNFFELGGNSLFAVQLVARIREVLQLETTVRDIFQAPTVAGLARRLEQAAGVSLPGIVRADRSGLIPLSWQQEHMLLAQRVIGASRAHNVRDVRLRLNGAIDVAALRRALDTMLERHEILRTKYVLGPEVLGQKIGNAVAFPLRELDLSNLSPEKQDAEVFRIQEIDADEPFDLDAGLLVRAILMHLSAHEHVFLVTMHRTVTDPWSTGVFSRETQALYEAYQANQPNPLRPLSIQYADYAAFQRSRMQGPALQATLAFWREHLRGAPPCLNLPLARPRTETWYLEGEALEVQVDRDLSIALTRLAHDYGATKFIAIYTAFSILMSCVSGQRDLLILVPTANRERAETEPLMGFFVTALPIRMRFDELLTVREILIRAREAASGCFAHQGLPLDMVLKTTFEGGDRHMRGQVSCLLHNAPKGEVRVRGVAASDQRRVARGATRRDLSLVLEEFDGHLYGEIYFASALFDRATIERWAVLFMRIMEIMTRDAGCTFAAIVQLVEKETEVR